MVSLLVVLFIIGLLALSTEAEPAYQPVRPEKQPCKNRLPYTD